MSEPAANQLRPTDRHFRLLLLAIAAAGVVPCLIVGRQQFIGPDSWWHLFIATQDQWSSLLAEWKYVAHPPLYYPLLRLVAHFGHALLVLRSIGILAGFVSTIVIGLIASKICRHRTSALLTAGAYALSWSMIEIHCEVRAYALALVFVLLAFNAFIDFTADPADPAGPASRRALLRFSLYFTLALLSEFYVIFFLAACVAILILRFLLRPTFRDAFLRSLRADWLLWSATAASLLALFVILWVVQIAVQPPAQPYLHTHYWDDTSPYGLDGYLLSNFEEEIGYFTPFHLDPAIALPIACFVLLPALIYTVFLRRNRYRSPAAPDAPLMLALLLAQLVVLSLAARYPFGGQWRHQSIIAPFVFLTAFLLLDRLATNALFAIAALLIAANFAYGFAHYSWQPIETYAAEYTKFEQLFPASEVRVIYGDQCSTVLYWAAHHNATWTLQNRLFVDGHRIIDYRMNEESTPPVRVLRNKKAFYFDLADPEQYQVLADVMRQENLHSLLLFDEGLTHDPATLPHLETQLHQLATQAGLQIGRYTMGPNYAFAEVTRR